MQQLGEVSATGGVQTPSRDWHRRESETVAGPPLADYCNCLFVVASAQMINEPLRLENGGRHRA